MDSRDISGLKENRLDLFPMPEIRAEIGPLLFDRERELAQVRRESPDAEINARRISGSRTNRRVDDRRVSRRVSARGPHSLKKG